MKRDLLSIRDLSKNEIYSLIDLAKNFKKGSRKESLKGMSVVLVFEKASTRTHVSFDAGINRLGGHPIMLTPTGSQIGRGEPVKDTARVLSRYCDMIVMRTYSHSNIEQMAQYASVPVINALTDLVHPCQVLSDCMTIIEKFGSIEDKTIAWVGDGNNMANSWINASARLGFKLKIATPEGYGPDKKLLDMAAIDGARITLTDDPFEAVSGAISVNTDVWASMGKEKEVEERTVAFKDFQVNARLMSKALPDAVFMHCLPAHINEEVSADVFESVRSIVWDQAENRLHMQEAIMDFLASNK